MVKEKYKKLTPKKFKKKKPKPTFLPPRVFYSLLNVKMKWPCPVTKEYIEGKIAHIKKLLRKNSGGVLKNYIKYTNVPYTSIPCFKYATLRLQFFVPDSKVGKIYIKINEMF